MINLAFSILLMYDVYTLSLNHMVLFYKHAKGKSSKVIQMLLKLGVVIFKVFNF